MNLIRITKTTLFVLLICFFVGCADSNTYTVSSPDGKTTVTFSLADHKAFYSVTKDKKEVVTPSLLGFKLSDNNDFDRNFVVIGTKESTFDETWQQPWGEEINVRNHYNELTINLQEKTGKKRLLNIVFRAFDDGIGFRYEFPEQENLKEFEIINELTEFALAKNDSIWTQHLEDRDYEQLYRKSTISEIKDTVSTPVTIETSDNKYIVIHEAALIDYAKMNLYAEKKSTLKNDLTPWANGVKVYAKTPFISPWRTIVMADNLNDLVNSRLMLNLNEPNKIENTEWIKPMKYIGIWWGMHMKTMTWVQGPKHGATTENMMRYIDFAAKNNIQGVLAEGWNVGWEGYMVGDGTKFKFATPYSDFDLDKISKYAAERGVDFISHNETAAAVTNYENQLDSSFSFAQRHGIHAIKTGYVGPLFDGKERHTSQFGVRHYRKVVETAAKYQIMIDAHEPVMPTGWQRTYPNLMTQEGVRGQEWDAWSVDGGNPPNHTTIIPFTRSLAGPIDFTPGTFNFENKVIPGTRVQTTIAKQLALFVVIYSPLQMASDIIENYENRPEFEFIRVVPVDWQKTLILDGKIGDFVITARKDKHSSDWYLGAITNENPRTVKIDFSFLDKGKKYIAQIYRDASESDWKTNPYSIIIEEKEITSDTKIDSYMAPGGGVAIRLRAL